MENQSDMILQAAAAINAGEVIVFPTETVYCVGADASNRAAVARLFEVKNRPKFDPLIVHISDVSQVKELADDPPAKAKTLMDKFWPGALTIILPRKSSFHDIASAGTSGVSLRLPSNQIAREIIKQAGKPIAAASANTYGNVSPTCMEHVHSDLGNAVKTCVDDGPCAIGIETTIVSFLGDDPVMLRPGAIPREKIEGAIGPLPVAKISEYNALFPGMSDHHYTRKSVMLFEDEIKQFPQDMQIGLISFKPLPDTSEFAAVEVLSKYGDLDEAARNLFSALRRLDALDLDLVVAQRVPDIGLGAAINDRLARACF
jgi:L-threonylcarbamoyladenylate synthase